MLSEAAKQRLKASLIQTLQEAVVQLDEALKNNDWRRIYAIGHSLKGNSGAHFFGLERVRLVGETLEKVSALDPSLDTRWSHLELTPEAAKALTIEARRTLQDVLASL